MHAQGKLINRCVEFSTDEYAHARTGGAYKALKSFLSDFKHIGKHYIGCIC